MIIDLIIAKKREDNLKKRFLCLFFVEILCFLMVVCDRAALNRGPRFFLRLRVRVKSSVLAKLPLRVKS